jgi:LemA protein
MTGLLIALAIAALLLVWIAMMYNRLVRLRNEAEQGASSIDVQLKRRADLVPNLVEAVKGYATHERETFERIATARAATMGATNLDERAAADGLMQSAITGLLGIAEAYPQLRAVEAFTALQAQLADTEDKIAAARRYYNSVVRRLNTAVETVPTNLVANATGVGRKPFYRLEDDADREPVAVSL